MQMMWLMMSYTQPNITTSWNHATEIIETWQAYTCSSAGNNCITVYCRYSLVYTNTTKYNWVWTISIFCCSFSLSCFYLINNTNGHLLWCLELIMVPHTVHINNGKLSARTCYNLHQIKTLCKIDCFLSSLFKIASITSFLWHKFIVKNLLSWTRLGPVYKEVG